MSIIDKWLNITGDLPIVMELSKPYMVRILNALSKEGETHISKLLREGRVRSTILHSCLDLLEKLDIAEVKAYGKIQMVVFKPKSLKIEYKKGRGVKIEIS